VGEQKTAYVNVMKLGNGKDFPIDANLKGITIGGHKRNSFAVGDLVSFSEDPTEWKTSEQTYAGILRRRSLSKI